MMMWPMMSSNLMKRPKPTFLSLSIFCFAHLVSGSQLSHVLNPLGPVEFCQMVLNQEKIVHLLGTIFSGGLIYCTFGALVIGSAEHHKWGWVKINAAVCFHCHEITLLHIVLVLVFLLGYVKENKRKVEYDQTYPTYFCVCRTDTSLISLVSVVRKDWEVGLYQFSSFTLCPFRAACVQWLSEGFPVCLFR